MARRFLLAALVVGLVSLSVGAGTFALFTDSASNGNNSFAAGTIDINVQRDDGQPVPGPMFYVLPSEGNGGTLATGDWWPGRMVSRNLDVNNVGSLSAVIRRVSATITDGTPSDSIDDTILMDALQVEIRRAPYGAADVIWSGSLADLVAEPQGTVDTLVAAPGGTQHLQFNVTMSPEAGNEYQGLRAIVAFNIHVEQLANNP